MTIPLVGADGQQFQAMRNGRFLYDGGFTQQPIRTLTGAQLISNVRSLHLEVEKANKQDEPLNLTKLTTLQQDLHMVIESGY
jgi:hypothetical protein